VCIPTLLLLALHPWVTRQLQAMDMNACFVNTSYTIR